MQNNLTFVMNCSVTFECDLLKRVNCHSFESEIWIYFNETNLMQRQTNSTTILQIKRISLMVIGSVYYCECANATDECVLR